MELDMKDKVNLFNGLLEARVGDITKENTDVIVNAANSSLLGGGGVDGAIHREGGPEILKECKKIRENQLPNGLETGNAVITNASRLSAKYVIHTVGPIWKGGNNNEEDLLEKCYTNSLKLAVENNCKTISFPSISTGAFGFPRKKAMEVALKAVHDFISKDSNVIKNIRLVFFSKEDLDLFKNVSEKYI
jgi:O-acetyl-ADP-ribose deacetylase